MKIIRNYMKMSMKLYEMSMKLYEMSMKLYENRYLIEICNNGKYIKVIIEIF